MSSRKIPLWKHGQKIHFDGRDDPKPPKYYEKIINCTNNKGNTSWNHNHMKVFRVKCIKGEKNLLKYFNLFSFIIIWPSSLCHQCLILIPRKNLGWICSGVTPLHMSMYVSLHISFPSFLFLSCFRFTMLLEEIVWKRKCNVCYTIQTKERYKNLSLTSLNFRDCLIPE